MSCVAVSSSHRAPSAIPKPSGKVFGVSLTPHQSRSGSIYKGESLTHSREKRSHSAVRASRIILGDVTNTPHRSCAASTKGKLAAVPAVTNIPRDATAVRSLARAPVEDSELDQSFGSAACELDPEDYYDTIVSIVPDRPNNFLHRKPIEIPAKFVEPAPVTAPAVPAPAEEHELNQSFDSVVCELDLGDYYSTIVPVVPDRPNFFLPRKPIEIPAEFAVLTKVASPDVDHLEQTFDLPVADLDLKDCVNVVLSDPPTVVEDIPGALASVSPDSWLDKIEPIVNDPKELHLIENGIRIIDDIQTLLRQMFPSLKDYDPRPDILARKAAEVQEEAGVKPSALDPTAGTTYAALPLTHAPSESKQHKAPASHIPTACLSRPSGRAAPCISKSTTPTCAHRKSHDAIPSRPCAPSKISRLPVVSRIR
ncbi:hypothetical protein K488DRAFT_83656 [Vararia minispora EC-137]|uniref:Uncharacterized protein n=1 Tax=Vararia minispora EC-137 TaxID=1314806 RepID=A0ACB8QTQ2_9AGAM|nr:hypothetical protein K488DRAFT_83656 [Vararia minispora EC-137]